MFFYEVLATNRDERAHNVNEVNVCVCGEWLIVWCMAWYIVSMVRFSHCLCYHAQSIQIDSFGWLKVDLFFPVIHHEIDVLCDFACVCVCVCLFPSLNAYLESFCGLPPTRSFCIKWTNFHVIWAIWTRATNTKVPFDSLPPVNKMRHNLQFNVKLIIKLAKTIYCSLIVWLLLRRDLVRFVCIIGFLYVCVCVIIARLEKVNFFGFPIYEICIVFGRRYCGEMCAASISMAFGISLNSRHIAIFTIRHGPISHFTDEYCFFFARCVLCFVQCI